MQATDDVLTKTIRWDTTHLKGKIDDCVDRAAAFSRENAKRSTSAFFPFLFSSILTALYLPVSIVTSMSDYLSGKTTHLANGSIDSSARYSSDVAKRSLHATIDSSANSSRRVWKWFN